MRSIEYYQCHINSDDTSLKEINGTQQPVEDIAARALSDASEIDTSDFGISPAFDPLCRTKTSQWEQSFATMIYAITGQVPAREEIKAGRRIIENLPRSFKQEHVDESFVLGPLAYVVAFQKTTEAAFQVDTNNVRMVANSLEQLTSYTGDNLTLNSLLCGHRVDSAVKKNSLIDTLPIDKVRRTARLITGLGRNACKSPLTIDWYQQQPTIYASSNMFPTVFERYVVDTEVPELFTRLAHYSDQIRTLFDGEQSEDVTYHIKSLDDITTATLSLLENYPEWQDLTPNASQLDPQTADLVAMTQPEISRFAQSYGNSREAQADDYIAQNVAMTSHEAYDANPLDVAGAISWFYDSLSMSLSAKALYEVCLSRTWGRINATSDAIGIGIDRDHTRQRPLGYAFGQQEAGLPSEKQVPLLYGRFKKDEKAASLLSSYNVRQFWT